MKAVVVVIVTSASVYKFWKWFQTRPTAERLPSAAEEAASRIISIAEDYLVPLQSEVRWQDADPGKLTEDILRILSAIKTRNLFLLIFTNYGFENGNIPSDLI